MYMYISFCIRNNPLKKKRHTIYFKFPPGREKYVRWREICRQDGVGPTEVFMG
jgi:hypothetical protein